MTPTAYPAEFEESCRWYPRNIQVVDRTGKVRPFVLYPIQKELEYEVWKARQQGEPCFLIVLKARREGVSTWAAARFYRDSKEFEHHKSLVMAHDDASTRNVLDMVRFFYKSDPAKPDTEKDSVAALKFKSGSEFFIYTAGARARAARSFNAQGIHVSEIAYFPDPGVYDAIMQVTPNTYPTLVIIESTASGPDDAMDQHWRQAVEGSSGFVPKFFAWFNFGEYARDLTYKDLIARGPKAYVEANRLKLEEEKNALGEGKPITLRDLRAAALLGDSGSGGPGAKTTGAQGSSLADAGTEVEGTGPRRRGPVPSREAGWDDDTRPSGDGRRKRSKRVSRQGLLGGGHEPERLPSGHDVEILKKIALRNLHSEEYLTTIATRFRESLTEYEQGLIAEFDLSLEQINWLRWITHVKCRGDDLVRRREYPSRPEEAFEAASEIVLDPNTLKQWMRASEPMPKKTIHFQIMELMDGTITVCPTESIVGNTTIWKEPVAGRDYVMGVDPSSGLTEGDWQVACVLDVETGEQVAEFRGKLDPDVAIGQIEGLGVYYNKAFTGCEANSIGLAFNRALADSGSLPLFEREQPDRNEPWKKTKILGWITNARTRDTLITEVRKAVREARCPIRSMETLREGRTLIVTRKPNSPEKIEARPGYHDDGIFAYGLALLMRNRQLPEEPTEEGESQIKKEEVPELVQRLLEDLSEPSRLPIHARGLRHIGGGGQRYIDKRRWVL